jgi:tetrathionate reductase subunit C
MSNIIEVLNVSRPIAWLPWAVQYFCLIGLSVGCFLLAMPGIARRDERWRATTRLALLGALACGIAAPVALLGDLHQPGRFWEFYTRPNLGSWMARGAFFIPGYLAGLFACTWLVVRDDLAHATGDGLLARLHRFFAFGGGDLPRLRRAALVWTLAFSLALLVYTGMEVMVVRARPVWNTPLLPVQFAVTAFAGAIGLVLLLDGFYGLLLPAMAARLARLLADTLIAALVVGALWLASAVTGIDTGASAALAAIGGQPAWQATALWAGVSALVPILLVRWLRVGPPWLIGLFGLHVAWMFRWTVFIGGQTVPKTGAGLYPYSLPLGHDGMLGILGIAGLTVFLLIALAELTAILGPRSFGRVRPSLPGAA